MALGYTRHTSPHRPAHEHLPLPTVLSARNAHEHEHLLRMLGNYQEITRKPLLTDFSDFLGRSLVIIRVLECTSTSTGVLEY